VSASRSVDARLMAVLRSTGEWDRHCSAVRRYLLLGQVSYVVLMEVVASHTATVGIAVRRPAHTVHVRQDPTCKPV
jgi:hypothetical protein